MIVDAHQHFWRFNPQRDTWINDDMALLKRDFLPDDLAPELRAAGVDATIAVQADQSEAETMFLLELAERYVFIAGAVGWVDLRAADVADRLRRFARFPKLRGFRHVVQSEPDERFLLREPFLRGIAALAAFNFTYDILILHHQLPAAIEFVGKFPSQPFVLDHLAKPLIKSRQLQPWSDHIRALAAHPNVCNKISGLVNEADWRNWRPTDLRPYLDVALNAFGPARLMFGSDWPVCLLATGYGQWHQVVQEFIAPLSTTEKSQILGTTAARFYNLNSAN